MRQLLQNETKKLSKIYNEVGQRFIIMYARYYKVEQKFITKYVRYYKVTEVYYKVRHVLQNVIEVYYTKCVRYFITSVTYCYY